MVNQVALGSICWREVVGLYGKCVTHRGYEIWMDLGEWWTLNSQMAIEHNFAEDASELVFAFGLVKTVGTLRNPSGDDPGHPNSAGLLSFLLETSGKVALPGPEDGLFRAEGIVGLVYGINNSCDFRVGYEFPVSSPRALNGGLAIGFIKHL